MVLNDSFIHVENVSESYLKIFIIKDFPDYSIFFLKIGIWFGNRLSINVQDNLFYKVEEKQKNLRNKLGKICFP